MANLEMAKDSNFIYLGIRQWMSPKQNLLNFAKFGDPVSYENHEFIVNPVELDLNAIPLNAPVKLTFELGLYNNRTSLNLKRVSALQTAVKV